MTNTEHRIASAYRAGLGLGWNLGQAYGEAAAKGRDDESSRISQRFTAAMENAEPIRGEPTPSPLASGGVREALSEALKALEAQCVYEEFDYPGDVPESCGMYCQMCSKHIGTRADHEAGCAITKIDAALSQPADTVKEKLAEACRDFVAKVDRGEARSKRSYAQMSEALAAYDKERGE